MRHVWFDYDVDMWKWIVKSKRGRVIGYSGSQEVAERSSKNWYDMYKESGEI